jgi:hypothetical protein
MAVAVNILILPQRHYFNSLEKEFSEFVLVGTRGRPSHDRNKDTQRNQRTHKTVTYDRDWSQ